MRIKFAMAALAGALSMPMANAAEVELKVATALAANTSFGEIFVDFVKHVNETGKGKLQLRMIGGPEAVPPFEMGTAVQNGVVDLAHIPGNYYEKLVPAATAVGQTEIPISEQRKNGAYDYLDKLHQDGMNAKLLTLWGYGIRFHIYTTKKTDGANLSGMKIRVAPGHADFVRSLGATVIQTPPGEVYTALERGVVSGYAWPIWGIKDLGWHTVTKYRIEPGFRNVEIAILINLDKYKGLVADQRQVLDDSVAWFDDYADKLIQRRNEEERQIQADAGIQVIQLNESQAKEFNAKARDTGWSEAIKKAPKEGERLRQLLTKD